MQVKDIGEFELMARIRNVLGPQPGLLLGIGDDACAWEPGFPVNLATTDSLVEGVHFDFSFSSWEDLGWKSLAVNLSDIAAMGATPGVALVSLALPGTTQVEDVISFYHGMLELAKQTGALIGGGNISSSPVVNISVALTGSATGVACLMKRTGARPGEKIAVTGFPGSAASGFYLLAQKKMADTSGSGDLVKRFLRPQPRINEGTLLAENGVLTAIDTSDGLLADLQHVLNASGAGAVIDLDCVPIGHLEKSGLSKQQALKLALTGGEDYELLFTANPGIMENVSGKTRVPVSIIGEITGECPGEIRLKGDPSLPLKFKKYGWRHFG